MFSTQYPPFAVLALTYGGIALGGLPWLTIDRTGEEDQPGCTGATILALSARKQPET
jgi:hypothetical protein